MWTKTTRNNVFIDLKMGIKRKITLRKSKEI